MGSAIQTQTRMRLRKPLHQEGSLDRRFDRSSSHFALSPRHQRAVQESTGCFRSAVTRVIVAPCQLGPSRWPITAEAVWRFHRSMGGTSAHSMALREEIPALDARSEPLRVERPVMLQPPRWWWPSAGTPPRASSAPMPHGPFCWQVPQPRLCAACARASPATSPSSACCLASWRP